MPRGTLALAHAPAGQPKCRSRWKSDSASSIPPGRSVVSFLPQSVLIPSCLPKTPSSASWPPSCSPTWWATARSPSATRRSRWNPGRKPAPAAYAIPALQRPRGQDHRRRFPRRVSQRAPGDPVRGGNPAGRRRAQCHPARRALASAHGGFKKERGRLVRANPSNRNTRTRRPRSFFLPS